MEAGFCPLTPSRHNITTYGEALWKERVWVSNVVCPMYALLASRAEQTKVNGLEMTMGGQGPFTRSNY